MTNAPGRAPTALDRAQEKRKKEVRETQEGVRKQLLREGEQMFWAHEDLDHMARKKEERLKAEKAKKAEES